MPAGVYVCLCVREREGEKERNLGKKRARRCDIRMYMCVCVGGIMSVRCGLERERECVCL